MNTNPALVITLSILPGLLWVWFFYRQDIYDKEPKILIVRTFLLGGLMVLPAGIIEAPFRAYLEGSYGFIGLLVAGFLVVGLVEETLKLYGMHLSIRREQSFNEIMDGIIYSVTAGLGFATLENILYIGAFGPQVGAVRAVLTNLAHACFSGFAGYYYGTARMHGSNRQGYLLKGLLLATAVHGIYDVIVLGRFLPGWVAIAFIAFCYIVLRSLISKALLKSPFGPMGSDENR